MFSTSQASEFYVLKLQSKVNKNNESNLLCVVCVWAGICIQFTIKVSSECPELAVDLYIALTPQRPESVPPAAVTLAPGPATPGASYTSCRDTRPRTRAFMHCTHPTMPGATST